MAIRLIEFFNSDEFQKWLKEMNNFIIQKRVHHLNMSPENDIKQNGGRMEKTKFYDRIINEPTRHLKFVKQEYIEEMMKEIMKELNMFSEEDEKHVEQYWKNIYHDCSGPKTSTNKEENNKECKYYERYGDHCKWAGERFSSYCSCMHEKIRTGNCNFYNIYKEGNGNDD